MCMQANGHEEDKCSGTRESWEAAQVNFSETSADLGEIREVIATMHIENQRPRRGGHNRGGHRH